jgi:hypothetical protein
MQSKNCFCLDLHEIESYLCDPTLLATLAGQLKLVSPIPEKMELEQMIIKFAEANLLRVAATRTFANTEKQLGVSIPRKALAAAQDEQALLTLLKQAAQSEVQRAQRLMSDSEIERLFRQQLAECRAAIVKKDIQRILVIFPGKELLSELARAIGCGTSSQLALAVKNHLIPRQYSDIARLLDKFPPQWQQ